MMSDRFSSVKANLCGIKKIKNLDVSGLCALLIASIIHDKYWQ